MSESFPQCNTLGEFAYTCSLSSEFQIQDRTWGVFRLRSPHVSSLSIPCFAGHLGNTAKLFSRFGCTGNRTSVEIQRQPGCAHRRNGHLLIFERLQLSIGTRERKKRMAIVIVTLQSTSSAICDLRCQFLCR